MISRRGMLGVLGAGASGLPCAWAQPPKNVWRLGLLETAPAELNVASLEALRLGLRELGYIEGDNLVIEYRSPPAGRAEALPSLAAELVALQVDLFVTRGTPATRAAQAASKTIPIVMAANAEPLGVGLVDSLARPGGNVTGLSAVTIELVPKLVEILRELVPGMSQLGVLTNLDNPAGAVRWESAQQAARTLGVEARLLEVRRAEDLAPAFAAAKNLRIDALLTGMDTTVRTNMRTLVELAAAHRLPTIYGSREFVAAGGLISYGADFPTLYRRAASVIDKIIKGTRPGDIPVEQPTAVEMVINLAAAKRLGLTISSTLLARADEVIE